jgi:pimeloyl-ACP methyl ester carboxylesterase
MKRHIRLSLMFAAVAALSSTIATQPSLAQTPSPAARHATASTVSNKTITIDGLDIFYREAGPKTAPTLLLLHGFPTSSHMFRDLIPALADKYHVIAPDYPGFGYSSMPKVNEFDYSFDNLASVVEKFTEKVGLTRYSLYLMDYGAPVGFRIAAKHPERIETLIIQNGNAYDEGINNIFWEPIKEYWKDRDAVNKGLDNAFWKNVKAAYNNPNLPNEDALRFVFTLGATKWQYTNGVRNVEAISPDTWGHVQPLLDREGNQEIQLQLFYSYGTNPPLYPQWQAYFRKHQPPTLIVWGAKDAIFPAAGAEPYKRDLKNLEFHLFDTGHFALEEDGQEIVKLIRGFLDRTTKKANAKLTPKVEHVESRSTICVTHK